jgi:hypothetical protein
VQHDEDLHLDAAATPSIHHLGWIEETAQPDPHWTVHLSK